jgi:GAF domain-containing protein
MPQTNGSGELKTALQVLHEAATRASVGGRMLRSAEERLLHLAAQAALDLFGATAASIAMYEDGALVFRAAAGPTADVVVGLSLGPSDGIVGYVFSTGEPVALADITADPRHDRKTAALIGYEPRSVLAVPLVVDGGVVGVLEMFDKNGDESFSVRDMELVPTFAAVVASAIGGTRVQRDLPALLAGALARISPDLSGDQVEGVITEVTAGIDAGGQSAFWSLVDRVSRLRDLGENELELTSDILDAVETHRSHRRAGRAAR